MKTATWKRPHSTTKGAYTAAQGTYDIATRATVPEDEAKAELDLTQARANLDLTQSIVNSRTQLFAQGAIPGRDLDTAKAALVQAQAAYDIAKQHLDAVQKSAAKPPLNGRRDNSPLQKASTWARKPS